MLDIHAATEGHEMNHQQESLRAKFLALGFTDDELAEQYLTFGAQAQVLSAEVRPIQIHMSRKCRSRKDLEILENAVRSLYEKFEVPGYWHTEAIITDETLLKNEGFAEILDISFCAPFVPERRPQKKVWDIHLTAPQSTCRQAQNMLLDHGFYLLKRWKWQNQKTEPYLVFTVQGTNHITEGRRFFQRMLEWGHGSGISWEAKFEATLNMEQYHSPTAVPPTIDVIHWT